MSRMIARLSALAAATGGVSAIEFALIAAFLILPLTIGLYDFGTAMYRWMEVGNAARAAAAYANAHTFSTAYDTQGQTCSGPPPTTNLDSAQAFTCAVQAATNLPVSATGLRVRVDPSVSPNPYCGCQSGSSFSVQSYSPVAGGGCNSCDANHLTNCCPAGQTALTMGQFTANYTYKPLFNYLGIGPSNGFNLSATATALIF